MKKDEFVTEVIFRRWTQPKTINKCILALFPYVINDFKGNVMSYEIIGQHGGANYNYCIEKSVPAKPCEYADTLRELTQYYGYNLKIIKKMQYKKWRKAFDVEIQKSLKATL